MPQTQSRRESASSRGKKLARPMSGMSKSKRSASSKRASSRDMDVDVDQPIRRRSAKSSSRSSSRRVAH